MSSNSHDRDNASSVPGTPSARGAEERAAEPRATGVPATGAATGRVGSDRTSSATPGRTTPTSASAARDADRATSGSGTGQSKGKGEGTAKKAGSGGDWNVFRTVVVLVGLVIAGFGAYYLIAGTAGLPDTEADPVNPTLENQFRFFSAMMVGVGAAFITIAIKFQWANMLWLVCLMVFVGGIGRVLSWAFSGTPNYVLIILMVVELAFPPALLVWHKYIAKTAELRREFAQRD